MLKRIQIKTRKNKKGKTKPFYGCAKHFESEDWKN